MSTRPFFEPFAQRSETIVIDAGLAAKYGLGDWAGGFALGTAGYRDLENTENLFDPGVPFNPLTMAVITEAESRLYRKGDTVHIGGEVRAWTQEHIDLAARIYAAKGIACRLAGESDEDGPILTTPIWLSSFGVFYEELAGGENFTSSHSQFFKGGRKPMDGLGMQLLEQAQEVEKAVREIVAGVMAGRPLTIELAPSDSPLIRRDFRVASAYAESLRSIVTEDMLASIHAAGKKGFRAVFCPEGGSMGRNSRLLFRALGIPPGPDGIVRYRHFEENAQYHGIGQVEGVNHGVDPGKWQIYRNVGAQQALLSGEADVFFIWDPDGDRFNMVTTAPASLEARALENGLETEAGRDGRMLVYFKPNQIYFMLLCHRLEGLKAEGAGPAAGTPWVVMETFPTSRSLGELAQHFDVPVFRTPVGFKHFGNACAALEEQGRAGAPHWTLSDVRGRKQDFLAGSRIMLMAEESGGAAMGGIEPLTSRSGRNRMLALKEKDGFQVGLIALALAATLHLRGGSFAEYYLDRLDAYGIRHRFYERRDVTLFDEALKGEARKEAQQAGNLRKDRTVGFFRGLADDVAAGRATPDGIGKRLQAKIGGGCTLPPLVDAYWAGDGTLLEFDGAWFQLRASGTDAVLRYYAESTSQEAVRRLNDALLALEV